MPNKKGWEGKLIPKNIAEAIDDFEDAVQWLYTSDDFGETDKLKFRQEKMQAKRDLAKLINDELFTQEKEIEGRFIKRLKEIEGRFAEQLAKEQVRHYQAGRKELATQHKKSFKTGILEEGIRAKELIDKARKEVLEEIEKGLPRGKIKRKNFTTDEKRYPIGFNVCLSEIKQLIKSLKEK